MRQTKIFTVTLLVLLGAAITGCASTRTSAVSDVYQTQAQSSNTTEQLTRMMNELIIRRDVLRVEIDNTIHQINATSKSKSKKLNKQLIELQAEYDAVNRKLAALPRSITDPVSRFDKESEQADQFREEMQKKYQERLSEKDYKDLIDDVTDPELRRIYQSQLNAQSRSEGQVDSDSYIPKSYQSAPANGVYYSVMLLKARKGLADTFEGVKDVKEYRLESGRTAYHTGVFYSEEQTRIECEKIRKQTPYKEAYIVAFLNGKLVSLDEARRNLKYH